MCKALFDQKCLWKAPWKWVDPLVYGLPISALVTVVVNLFTRPPAAEHIEKCFGSGGKAGNSASQKADA